MLENKSSSPSAIAWLIADDLIFESRIRAQTNEANVQLVVYPNPNLLWDDASGPKERPIIILVDLGYLGFAGLGHLTKLCEDFSDASIIAYGPHIDAELLRAARRCGCEQVLPRSEFVKRLPHLFTPTADT